MIAFRFYMRQEDRWHLQFLVHCLACIPGSPGKWWRTRVFKRSLHLQFRNRFIVTAWHWQTFLVQDIGGFWWFHGLMKRPAAKPVNKKPASSKIRKTANDLAGLPKEKKTKGRKPAHDPGQLMAQARNLECSVGHILQKRGK